jgi:hypothetical protein
VTHRAVIALASAAALAGLAACGGAASPPTAAASPGGPVRFVQETRADAELRSAGREGVLQLDASGCFRLAPGGPALVWPAEAALDLTEPGVVRVFNTVTGQAVRVGDRVQVVGGLAAPGELPVLNRPLGPCAGALWEVAAFEARRTAQAEAPRRFSSLWSRAAG